MHADELKELFDRQAPGYDQQWAKLAPIREALHMLVAAAFSEVPPVARILCVGAGTGQELAYLAQRHPRWRFTLVEPAAAMLQICRDRAEADGHVSRCQFHQGYLDTLPEGETHHAATCFLVSQFILDPVARSALFGSIARRLRGDGLLASSDLASQGPDAYEAQLRIWVKLMAASDVSDEAMDRMRAAYQKDVAILPPSEVAAIIEAGGFEPPVPLYQAGLIHAWLSRRSDPWAHAEPRVKALPHAP